MSDKPDFLAHDDGDHVAVAVHDVEPGSALIGYLDGTDALTLEVLEAVPLGHKVALADVAAGDAVIEYQLPIGRASKSIRTGDYVHTHNVRSIKWQNSVA